MARGLGKNKRGFANSSVTRSVTSPIAAVELSDPVSLYLPFDSDVNDDSDNNHTVTAYNSAAISSTQSKFGGNSLYLDGTDQYLSLAGSTDFDFGTGDFTIEAWIYPTANQGSHIISAGGAGYWSISWNYTSKYFAFNRSNALGATETVGFQTPNFSLSLNQWQHVAVCRMGVLDGSTLKSRIKMFINGSEQTIIGNPDAGGVINASNSFDSDSSGIEIGRNYGSTNSTVHWKGYFDDIRIIKGLARYTKDFIPPSQAVGAKLSGANETNSAGGSSNTVNDLAVLYLPFDAENISTVGTPQSGNTVLLINGETDGGSNWYSDKSNYNQTNITVSGSPSRSTSSKKFGSGSMNFDNSGNIQVQSTDFAFGTGDFTIETWAIVDDADGDLFSLRQSGGGNKIGICYGSNSFRFKSDNHTTQAGLQYSADSTWRHHALVRYNGDIAYYIDGVLKAQDTSVSAINYTGSPIISLGGNQLQHDFDGRLDDFRVSNKAVYTSAFTSPSSQLDYSYTTFTNDFSDKARNHGIHTTGSDPAISTSVKKFGTGSLHLDGDDYLWYNHDESLNFGTNDFTVEGWFYVADDSSVGRWLGKSDVTTGEPYGWFIVSQTNNKWGFNAGSTTGSNAGGNDWDIANNADLGTLTLNTWTHLAVTREGNTFRLFNNGSLITTFTSSLSMTTGDQPLGIGRQGGNSSTANGYLDDVRIINGHALYTAAFTPPTAAVGLAVQGGGVTTTTVDNKFLSSVWSLKDQNKKISKGEWIRNDVADTGANGRGKVIKGAGLEGAGHRWYQAPTPDAVTFKVWGAGGAGGYWNGGSSGNGGSGGFAKGTFDGTPGTTYNIVVGIGGTVGGGTGAPAATGGNGASSGSPGHKGGQGGGYSGVFEGPVSQSNAFIIAGGGGGGGSYDRSGEDESGGGGGGTTGLDGVNPPNGGGGGTQSAGGSSGPAPAGDGSALQGGAGGVAPPLGMYGGGGGGGYFGGGGAAVTGTNGDEENAGGGGGSGYVAPALTTDTANLQGVSGTAGSTTGQTTAINPTASSDPDYTGSYGKGGGYNSSGNPGYVVITDSSGTYTFTSPGTHTLP